MSKTTWKELITKTKKITGEKFLITIWAEHYLVGYRKEHSTIRVYKSKWIALIMMKLIAIMYDFYYNKDYGIFYQLKAINETV